MRFPILTALQTVLILPVLAQVKVPHESLASRAYAIVTTLEETRYQHTTEIDEKTATGG